MGKRNGPAEILWNLTMTNVNSCPCKGRTACTYRQQWDNGGELPHWRAALSKRPAIKTTCRGSQWTLSWRESAETTKVVRGSGEAVALRFVLPGVFPSWLQGGPYSSSPIAMGSSEKMEPGPFVYGSRVKHNKHKLHNINEMFKLDIRKSFFSTRTVSATGCTVWLCHLRPWRLD